MAEEQVIKKKSILEWVKEHPKTVFVLRTVLWSLLACVIPFIIISVKFDFYSNSPKLSGWAIIGIIIVMVFVMVFTKYIGQCLSPGKMITQCLNGFVKVIIPLTALLAVTLFLENCLTEFRTVLGVTIVCEASAIPLNPFPALIEKKKQERIENTVDKATDTLWDKYFAKKKDEGK